jgi:uncharacterized OsmC-like protein
MDIAVTFPGGKRVDANFSGFTVRTDQPPEFGGDASEAAPYELFLASMATCAGIYALGFCQARKLPTEGLSVVQHHTFDPETHLVTSVRYTLQLVGGCTWGTRAGGLSRPRQRPPAIFSAPLSGLEHEGVGLTLARRP